MSAPLGETGQVYVTRAAALVYAERYELELEEARRLLTELLLEAHYVEERDGTERWRARSRSTGIDIGAHVSREERLAVVTHVNIRKAQKRKRRKA